MLLLSLIFLLLANAVTKRREKSILFNRVAIIILLYSSIVGYDSLAITSLGRGISIYGGLFHSTAITHSFDIFINLVSGIIIGLTAFNPRYLKTAKPLNLKLGHSNIDKDKLIKKGEGYSIIEYPLLLLFIVLGATFLMSSSDLVSMFLSIELQSYGLYIFATLYRNSELATSAGLSYFLLGGLSSCLILLGSTLLYINSGLTNLDGIYILASFFENKEIESLFTDVESFNKGQYFNISLIILSVGYLFKVAAAPFHFWSPEVYDAVPTVVTTTLTTIPKLSIFVLLLELVHNLGKSIPLDNNMWVYILLISSFLSLIIGTVAGLVQYRLKRLLAFSAISHVGFLLLALSVNSVESDQALIFYLVQYSLSNVNIFFIIIAIGHLLFETITQDKNVIERNNSPVQYIYQLKGLYHLNPIISISLAISIFSLAGIPPLVGFFGKQLILSAALEKGYYFLSLVGILTSVIGAVYYLGIVKLMFFESAEDKTVQAEDNRVFYLSTSMSIVISVITLMILLFMTYLSTSLRSANILALILSST